MPVLFGCEHFVRVAEGLFSQRVTFPTGEGICKLTINSLLSFTHLLVCLKTGADAFLWAMDQLGYPYLVVGGGSYNATNNKLAEVYKLIGDDVSMVIGDYMSGSSFAPFALANACRSTL